MVETSIENVLGGNLRKTTLVSFIVGLSGIICQAYAGTISVEKIFEGRKPGVQENLKLEREAIVELIKSDGGLRSFYNTEMENLFDFLPADQQPKAIELSTGDISPWKVSSYFRYGQGDYQLCDINTEEASYNYSTYLVGFNTSYKREETFGFWALVQVNWDWCSDFQDLNNTTRERLTVEFKKWIDSAAVDAILFQ